MGKLIKEKDEKGRLHIDTPLMGESHFRMQPDVNVLKIGGQSIMDRGAKALFPILDELVKAKEEHKILLMCGGGTRARHVYNIGVDLGMPTGVLSKLGDKVSAQNAEMLTVLLAKHGGAMIGHGAHMEQLHMYCQLGYLPITTGIPPYGWFEQPAEVGSIPPHRTDSGACLLAENIGAKSLIYLKDEKGLYEGDPKKGDRNTMKFYDKLHVDELIAMDLEDLIVERPVLTFLKNAKTLKSFQIIDVLRHPEHLHAALNGEHVGTIIYKD